MVHKNESTDQQNVVTFVTIYGASEKWKEHFVKLRLSHAKPSKKENGIPLVVLKSHSKNASSCKRFCCGLNYEFEEENEYMNANGNVLSENLGLSHFDGKC